MNRKNPKCLAQRSMKRNGFTLMELLIVMAIITILMLLAIPTVGALRKNGNRLSAIKSIQAIQTAQSMYTQIYGANGYACSLAFLGGDPNAGAPSPTSAQLLKADLTSGYKDGYIFTITNCVKNALNGSERVDGYTLTAVPEVVGKTGDLRLTAADEGGILKSGSSRRRQLRRAGPMTGTDSSGAGNPEPGFQGPAPAPASGSRRVPIFVWVLVGCAAFFFLCIIPILHSLRFLPSAA
jgi:type IV pilus assembly protein PilA